MKSDSKPLFRPALAGLFFATALASATAKPPNLVLLFVDDLGWGHVGYQNEQFETPNIDRLKMDGMYFANAYAASPTCSPSRAGLITGQHPARLGIVRHIPSYGPRGIAPNPFHRREADPSGFASKNWLPLEETTVAEVLAPLGYHSVFVGKWHLGHEPYHPANNGFDEQHGVTNFGHPGSYTAPFWKGRSETYRDAPAGKYLTDQLTDDAVRSIRSQRPDQPLFLSVFYYGVHTPNQGRADLVRRFEKKGLAGRLAQHAAQVAAVDESIGRIRAAIDAKGWAENTVLVFLSDQGGLVSNAPLRGGKAGGTALYEGSARIPMIVVDPGMTKAGTTCEVPVISTDIAPTLLERASGEPVPAERFDGVSLMPLLAEKGTLDREDIFLYRSYENQYAAVRSGPWKLVAYRDGHSELYNLDDDPAEAHDLAKEQPERTEAIRKRLTAWEKSVGVIPVPTGTPAK